MYHKFKPAEIPKELWVDFKYRYFDVLKSLYEKPLDFHIIEVNSSELTLWFDMENNLFVKVDNKNTFETPTWYMVKNVAFESHVIIPAHPRLIEIIENFQEELKYKAFREGDNVKISLFTTKSDSMNYATRMFDLGYLINHKLHKIYDKDSD